MKRKNKSGFTKNYSFFLALSLLISLAHSIEQFSRETNSENRSQSNSQYQTQAPQTTIGVSSGVSITDRVPYRDYYQEAITDFAVQEDFSLNLSRFGSLRRRVSLGETNPESPLEFNLFSSQYRASAVVGNNRMNFEIEDAVTVLRAIKNNIDGAFSQLRIGEFGIIANRNQYRGNSNVYTNETLMENSMLVGLQMSLASLIIHDQGSLPITMDLEINPGQFTLGSIVIDGNGEPELIWNPEFEGCLTTTRAHTNASLCYQLGLAARVREAASNPSLWVTQNAVLSLENISNTPVYANIYYTRDDLRGFGEELTPTGARDTLNRADRRQVGLSVGVEF